MSSSELISAVLQRTGVERIRGCCHKQIGNSLVLNGKLFVRRQLIKNTFQIHFACLRPKLNIINKAGKLIDVEFICRSLTGCTRAKGHPTSVVGKVYVN